MTDRNAELRSESRDLLALLQRLGDGEHDDLSVAHDALAEIINLRLQRAALLDCAEALEHVIRCIPINGFAQIHHGSATWHQIDAALTKLNGDDA